MFKSNISLSIKTKLILSSCIILILSISCAVFFNWRSSREALREKIDENMIANAEAAAAGIGKEVEAIRTAVNFIAADPDVRSGDSATISARLAEIKQSMGEIDSVVFTDQNGKYQKPDGTTASVGERAYFKDAVQKKQTIISGDPVVSQITKNLVAVLVAPVKDGQGELKGYLVAGINMDKITQYVINRKMGKTGYAYAFGSSGTFFAHPMAEMVMKRSMLDKDSSLELRDLAETVLRGEVSVKKYEFNGAMKYGGGAPIPGTSWGIGTTMNSDEAMEKLAAIRQQALIIMLVSLLIGGGLMYLVAIRISKPIIGLVGMANQMAEGDFTQTAQVESQDEIGQLSVAFNQMSDNLQKLIRHVQQNAEQVAASSEELTASAEQSAQAATQVAGSINQVADGAEMQLKKIDEASTVVQQMSSGIERIEVTANQVTDRSAEAVDAAHDGGRSVDRAIHQMAFIEETVDHSAQIIAQLGDRSKEIGQIVDTIAGIAGQTNLLALNAAIEAARAGEQGRGFAVVAEEVRKLAEQSQEAAKQIAELINGIQTDTDKAVTAMSDGTREVKVGTEVVKDAGEKLQKIASTIEFAAQQMKDISAAIPQIAGGSQQVVSAVKEIADRSKDAVDQSQTVSAATEEQSASMEEIASSSQSLAKFAQELQSAVGRFRV
ncbi:methyl-accepting chemotaxis protein [Anaerosinus massiliensis]|uniref:methyl-accepting chemotaxis protein n=1 Tax=Massilibacillus massiliensis TaxID=1806837 RepID=UPI000B0EE121|nr:methyl-accepting chemotaxis protein [Massilibacillus massiliensis]